ncbi:hypothetical protein Tco_1404543 [Tanacetum coccineum]
MSMVDEVTSLKKDFKQKENKYLEEFLDLKALKDKVEDKLFKQAQSIQTVHMMCKPSGHVIVTPNHAPAIRRDGEDTLELAKISRKKMHDKMKSNECVANKNLRKPIKSELHPLGSLNGKRVLNKPRHVTSRRKHDEIEWKNLLIANDILIADCLSKEEFHVASNYELNVSRFTEIQTAHIVVKARCLELEAELSNLLDNIQKDNHNELLNQFSNLEVNYLNLQLKCQNFKESFRNNPPPPASDTPDFNSVFEICRMKASLQGKDNVIQKLKMQISQLKETRKQNEIFRAKNAKIKQHYNELYDSIKIKHAKHLEQTTALVTKNESLKVQLQNTVLCVTKNHVKPNVLAPRKYAIDVEPISPRHRSNREVHLDYLRYLKESVDTLREIVEEAKVERPLDRSLASACRYTKPSHEPLEYVFDTCPKDFTQQDKKHAPTPRKKQVTFEDQIATSSSTTHKHVEKMHTQKSNVPVPPSTGVNSYTNASGSPPKSILK